MYFPLMIYLISWFRKTEDSIPIKYFLLCALVDIHATLFIVFSYTYTSITSVMLLEDFTIPSAILLSVFFLRIKYTKTHFLAIILCLMGMTVSLINDFKVKGDES